MDAMIAQLGLIDDGLLKKEKALHEVLNISENQQTVLRSNLDVDMARRMVFDMNEAKQEAIKIVIACDDMFEDMLKVIGEELAQTQHLYKPQVQSMQEKISRVIALDAKIR